MATNSMPRRRRWSDLARYYNIKLPDSEEQEGTNEHEVMNSNQSQEGEENLAMKETNNFVSCVKLPKEDMNIFGLCPSQDECILVKCTKCKRLFKQESCLHHMEVCRAAKKEPVNPPEMPLLKSVPNISKATTSKPVSSQSANKSAATTKPRSNKSSNHDASSSALTTSNNSCPKSEKPLKAHEKKALHYQIAAIASTLCRTNSASKFVPDPKKKLPSPQQPPPPLQVYDERYSPGHAASPVSNSRSSEFETSSHTVSCENVRIKPMTENLRTEPMIVDTKKHTASRSKKLHNRKTVPSKDKYDQSKYKTPVIKTELNNIAPMVERHEAIDYSRVVALDTDESYSISIHSRKHKTPSPPRIDGCENLTQMVQSNSYLCQEPAIDRRSDDKLMAVAQLPHLSISPSNATYNHHLSKDRTSPMPGPLEIEHNYRSIDPNNSFLVPFSTPQQLVDGITLEDLSISQQHHPQVHCKSTDRDQKSPKRAKYHVDSSSLPFSTENLLKPDFRLKSRNSHSTSSASSLHHESSTSVPLFKDTESIPHHILNNAGCLDDRSANKLLFTNQYSHESSLATSSKQSCSTGQSSSHVNEQFPGPPNSNVPLTNSSISYLQVQSNQTSEAATDSRQNSDFRHTKYICSFGMRRFKGGIISRRRNVVHVCSLFKLNNTNVEEAVNLPAVQQPCDQHTLSASSDLSSLPTSLCSQVTQNDYENRTVSPAVVSACPTTTMYCHTNSSEMQSPISCRSSPKSASRQRERRRKQSFDSLTNGGMEPYFVTQSDSNEQSMTDIRTKSVTLPNNFPQVVYSDDNNTGAGFYVSLQSVNGYSDNAPFYPGAQSSALLRRPHNRTECLASGTTCPDSQSCVFPAVSGLPEGGRLDSSSGPSAFQLSLPVALAGIESPPREFTDDQIESCITSLFTNSNKFRKNHKLTRLKPDNSPGELPRKMPRLMPLLSGQRLQIRTDILHTNGLVNKETSLMFN